MTAHIGDDFDFGMPKEPTDLVDDIPSIEDTDIEYDQWKDDRLDQDRER